MEVTARIATLELAETFVISRESQDTAEVVQVEIRHEDVSGFGEGAPIERYGESAESALQYIEDAAGVLGDDPFALDHIGERLEPREWAARSALDAALHDLQGKLVGEPICGHHLAKFNAKQHKFEAQELGMVTVEEYFRRSRMLFVRSFPLLS